MGAVTINVAIELKGDADACDKAAELIEGMPEFFQAVIAERAAQDKQWGGPEHDDSHPPRVWEEVLHQHVGRLTQCGDLVAPDYRQRLIKIAALAVAAAQSYDRSRPEG